MAIEITSLSLSIALDTFRTKKLPEFYCGFIFVLPNFSELFKIAANLGLRISPGLSYQKFFANFNDDFSYSYDGTHDIAFRSANKSLVVEIHRNPVNNSYTLALGRREYFNTNIDLHVLDKTKNNLAIISHKIYAALASHQLPTPTSASVLLKVESNTIKFGEKIEKTLLSNHHQVTQKFILDIINNVLAHNLLRYPPPLWRLPPVTDACKISPSARSSISVSRHQSILNTTNTSLPSSQYEQYSRQRPLPLLISRESFITLDKTSSPISRQDTHKSLLSPPPASPAPSSPFTPIRRKVTLAALTDRHHTSPFLGFRRY